MKRAITTIACAGLLASGCASATVVDARLTVLGRTAVPLAGQSQIQQVDDAATCRENIMDRFFYVGAYTLYNPFQFPRRDDMLYARQQQLAQCLRDRHYGVLEPLPPPVRD